MEYQIPRYLEKSVVLRVQSSDGKVLTLNQLKNAQNTNISKQLFQILQNKQLMHGYRFEYSDASKYDTK